jgi:beta-N-acetylhexosaminidase
MVSPSTLRDFGQLFIMAFDGKRLPPEIAEFFATFRIGGVILFADNYESPEQLSALTRELQAQCAPAEAPLFIMSDHEGGRVQRFRQGFTRVEPMSEYGMRSPADTEAVHRTMARELLAAGINWNLAPVADLCNARSPGAIGDRSFGVEPERVALHVSAAIRGLHAEGMLACVKHFPGHGATSQDSHRELPMISVDRGTLEARELVPFRAALAAGAEAVMTAHVVYPQAGDAEWPASLSPFWLSTVLRQQLGFQGLIVTDAIEMQALKSRWTPVECGLLAMRAGADLLLYYREAHQFTAFHELRRALEAGELDTGAVERSLERVRQVKRRFLTRPAG